jgi:putative transposase
VLADQFRHEASLRQCLKLLSLPRSSYYSHQHQRTLTERHQKLKPILHELIKKNPAYGYRRLKSALRKQKVVINHKLLKKLLKAWGLSLPRKLKKKRKSGIEKILHELGPRVHLVKTIPVEKRHIFLILYTDFTEICYQGGKVYLIVFLDDVSKRAVGYAIGLSATTRLALQAFSQSKRYLKRKEATLTEMIVHQDQGRQFTSYDYIARLTADGIAPSFSRRGHPEDNPAMESFYGRLKDEWDHLFREATSIDELKHLIQQALRYYNRSRIHSALDGMSPDEFLRTFPHLS